MKAIQFVLIMVMIAVMLGFNAGPAEASWFAAYDSSILLQNLEGSAGKVTLYFYNQDGTIKHTQGPDDIIGQRLGRIFPASGCSRFLQWFGCGQRDGQRCVRQRRSRKCRRCDWTIYRPDIWLYIGCSADPDEGQRRTRTTIPGSMFRMLALVTRTSQSLTVMGHLLLFHGLKKGASHTFDQAPDGKTHPVKPSQVRSQAAPNLSCYRGPGKPKAHLRFQRFPGR